MKKIGIIDCNNFYVSCERVFNPESIGKPTVVLSNNDGCVIARSQEAKNLKIKMGEPFFTKREFMQQHKFFVYSSNYNLYGDMSDRVMMVIKKLITDVEIYSIDECFVDLSDIPIEELEMTLHQIRNEVKKITGIPVSIGVGPNKTLAKLTSKIAKKQSNYNGVCSYWSINHFSDRCKKIPTDELWGIGNKWNQKLKLYGIESVYDLMRMDNKIVKKFMNVNGLRLKMELEGHYCFQLKTSPKIKKSLASTRSFGNDVDSFEQICEAMYSYIVWGVKKLRNNELNACNCTIFICGNIHKENRYYSSKFIRFQKQTKSADEIWSQVYPYLKEIYDSNKSYKKCGIIFNKLMPEDVQQNPLFLDELISYNVPVNHIKQWEMRREFITKKYTTDWDNIPVVN